MLHAWSYKGLPMLLWHRLCRQLEQIIHSYRPKYCQVLQWMDHILCWLPYYLGVQSSISSCAVDHGNWVHFHVHGLTRYHPTYGINQQNERNKFDVKCQQPYVNCKVFEGNSGAHELAWLPTLQPRTKHINVCYHHLREHVRRGFIKVFLVDTKDKIADALTKALAQNTFVHHHKYMCVQ